MNSLFYIFLLSSFALCFIFWPLPATSHSNSVGTNNPFPVIGILTQPSSFSDFPSTQFSYLPASYVKYLESAGALVVPIQWDMPLDKLDLLLDQINGVLLPGGSTLLIYKSGKPTMFSKFAQHIVYKSMEFYRNGRYLPIWGSCLGFELLIMSMSNNWTITSVKGGYDVARPLNVTAEGMNGIFSKMDSELLNEVQTTNLSYFHHVYTPVPAWFSQNPIIVSNFSVSAWAPNGNYGDYVAIAEGKIYPMIGNQYHPEKNTFEWVTPSEIPHSLSAVKYQQFMAEYFVNMTLKSQNRFYTDVEFLKRWINDESPKHFGPDSSFVQSYIFRNYRKYSISDELIAECPPDIKGSTGDCGYETPLENHQHYDEALKFMEDFSLFFRDQEDDLLIPQ